jgi:putative nucleotidyltransferase with HDIG domain
VSVVYRVRQFIRAAGTWVEPENTGSALVGTYLSREALDLFQAMPGYDRHHALNVLHTLQERGHTDSDLLTAALLHDVGKTVRQSGALRLWHRVAVVLMRAFWPDLLERIGEDHPDSWRQPFFVQQHHAAIGADLARQAGCSPSVVELILRHEDPPVQVEDDPLLAALQASDSVN